MAPYTLLLGIRFSNEDHAIFVVSLALAPLVVFIGKASTCHIKKLREREER
jgi:hypothetical protein